MHEHAWQGRVFHVNHFQRAYLGLRRLQLRLLDQERVALAGAEDHALAGEIDVAEFG
jgi:hypothetical protein